MSFTVAIVGRPNVGKSTLFNRLAGKRLALVHDLPGVTRDRREADTRVGGLDFRVIDTAGLEEVFDESLEARMRRQTERAVAESDVALFLIDARAGVTPIDQHFANWLRKVPTPVILLANKCEGRAGQSGLFEAYELGLGDPVPISAEHGEGLADLIEALLPYAPPEPETDVEIGETDQEIEAAAAELVASTADAAGDETDDRGKPLQLAIVGRPNVGKSTLFNSLVGEERVLTGPEAGMTRDSIAVEWTYRNRPFKLIDTAGLRRRARVDDQLEKLAVADGLRAVRLAHVVVLVMDASAILDRQDLTIARMVAEEGRALVIAVNKWDAVEDRKAASALLKDRLQSHLPQLRGVPTVMISALNRHNLDGLLNAVLEAYRVWNRRVTTGQLNRWLAEVSEAHPPPLAQGRRIRLRYVTQIKARPPTFALWVSKPVDLPESYQRYLVNSLRDSFDLPGVPIRLLLRKGRNPYAEK